MRHDAALTLSPTMEGRPVAVVVSVEFSPVTGGLLRTWSDDGSQLWQVWGGDGLAQMMGRGQLARTEVEPDRYREVGLLEQPSDTTSEGTGRLLLPARWQPGREGSPMELEMAGEPSTCRPSLKRTCPLTRTSYGLGWWRTCRSSASRAPNAGRSC